MADEFITQLADELRSDLESGVVPETEEIKDYLRILVFLASCSEDDINSLANTHAFDKIIEANCILAAKDAGINGEPMERLKLAISFRLDRLDAKEICKEYDEYRFKRTEKR